MLITNLLHLLFAYLDLNYVDIHRCILFGSCVIIKYLLQCFSGLQDEILLSFEMTLWLYSEKQVVYVCIHVTCKYLVEM